MVRDPAGLRVRRRRARSRPAHGRWRSPAPRTARSTPAAARRARDRGREQQVVEAHAAVALPAVPAVVPEGVEPRLVRVQRAQRVGPALREQAGVGGARRRAGPARCRRRSGSGRCRAARARRCSRRRGPPAGRSRAARRRGRRAAPSRRACSRTSARAAGCRSARRARRRARRRPRPRCSGLRVVRVAGQGVAGQHRLGAAGEDGDAVPGPLPAPDRAVSGGLERGARELGVGRLQLLQADDVGLPPRRARRAGSPGAC